MQAAQVHISITGLQVRAFYLAPLFWRHAMRSMAQAQAAQGCLQASARMINGIHHTRSVWIGKDYMRAYISSGAHLEAMKAFPKFATGKTIGFEAEEIPDWPEVHRIWQMHGLPV